MVQMSNETMEIQQNKSQTLTGQVISNAMDKTVTVLLVNKVKHLRYGKYIKRHSKLYAHDDQNQCKVGDVIAIEQCRPLSKLKTWQVVKILGSTEE